MVECQRAAARAGNRRVLQRVSDVLDAVYLLDLTTPVLEQAAGLRPTPVRSLDAIHIATAISVGDDDLDVITYDDRMAEAARANGLRVAQPGSRIRARASSRDFGSSTPGLSTVGSIFIPRGAAQDLSFFAIRSTDVEGHHGGDGEQQRHTHRRNCACHPGKRVREIERVAEPAIRSAGEDDIRRVRDVGEPEAAAADAERRP